jgi:hypothetical protein
VVEGDLSLDDLKAFYKRVIDDFAGVVRSRFVSTGEGMEMTYLYKLEEAKVFAADGYAGDEATFPFLFREATATAQTPEYVAQVILGNMAAWTQVGSVIEAQRLRGKKLVTEAVTPEEAKQEKDVALAALNSHG